MVRFVVLMENAGGYRVYVVYLMILMDWMLEGMVYGPLYVVLGECTLEGMVYDPPCGTEGVNGRGYGMCLKALKDSTL